MLSIMALVMIVVFLYVIFRNYLTIFSALTLIPIIFGLLAVLITSSSLTDLFDWIFAGVFFSFNEETQRIQSGVMPAALLIMFAVLYFNTMLDAGLFDKAIIFFIKFAKGDPLRIILATFLTSSVTSISGDTTTTIIICLSTFLALYKQLNMNLKYLALVTIGPSIIFNLLPWGGPTVSAALVTEVSLNDLFMQMFPGMIVGYLYVFGVAVHLGYKERRRLLALSKDNQLTLSNSQMETMMKSVYDRGRENKRYENNGFNLILTAVILLLLFADVAHGSVLFMLGTALAVSYNYKTAYKSVEMLEKNAGDALLPALGSIGAGVFSGILTHSGMAASLANDFNALIPADFGGKILPIYAIMTGLFLIILPTDAYFFGVTRILARTFEAIGISPMSTAVASLIGESWAIMSPTIASIHVLTKQTEQSMGEYHLNYIKYYGVLMFIWLLSYYLTGALVI